LENNVAISQLIFLNRIEFGIGAIEKLPQELSANGMRRPMLVTDRGLVATGLADRVLALAGSEVTLYDSVPPNPTEDAVMLARDLYIERGCDGIIALGGGSPLDFGNELPLARYAAIHGGTSLIGRTAVPDLVRGALADHSRPTNPREFSEEDAGDLYRELIA
jgi:4-hydroxybutyrate dehydrogenase